jgi:Rha family phage regulatory protein
MVNAAQLSRGRKMEQAQVLKPRITLIDGQVMTTSIVVARHFCKQHKDVLRTIDHAVEQIPADFNERNFALVPYRDAKGEDRRMYRMTRDGFALIAMGFTGKEAIAWKVAYISTFNAMEARLRQSSSCSENVPEIAAHRNHGTIINPIERGQPPLSPRPFQELFYALERDYGSTLFVTYLLSMEAHHRVLRASYREISKAMGKALSRVGVRDSAIRLAGQQLLWHEPGQPLGEPGRFLLLLDALSQRLADSRTQRHVGLTDGEVGEPVLLH